MLKWLSKMFEKICSICVIMNFVIGGIAGVIIGSSTGNVLFFFGGIIIAFFVNVMSFGFLAQIIEIRKKVDLLELECYNLIGNKEEI